MFAIGMSNAFLPDRLHEYSYPERSLEIFDNDELYFSAAAISASKFYDHPSNSKLLYFLSMLP